MTFLSGFLSALNSMWPTVCFTVAVLALAIAVYYAMNKPTQTEASSPPNLPNLPEELILLIFRAVHDNPIPPAMFSRESKAWAQYNQGTRDIQNIRLTCRQFARIGSELLVEFVGVELSSKSLARLRAIMHHTAIRKGVGMIRIRLPVYDRVLKEHQQMYVDEVRSKMNYHAEYMEKDTRELVSSYETGLRVHSPRTVKLFHKAIEPGYSEFRRRYWAQSLLHKRRFFEAVAYAMGMSSGKPLRLEITDLDDFLPLHVQSIHRATRHDVLDLLSSPRASAWHILVDRDRTLPRGYAWLVPRILAAFVDDRIRITHLHLDITRITANDNRRLERADTAAIQVVLREVRTISYNSRTSEALAGARSGLSSLLWSCLPPARLQILTLGRTQVPTQYWWPNLTTVVLSGVRVNARKLAHLLQAPELHRLTLLLHYCALFNIEDDTWADILELLRTKQRRALMYQPQGKEFDDFWLDRVSNEYVDPAGRYYGHCQFYNLVELYIQGAIHINPIREIPASLYP